jgi:phosphoglycolate phosphatase-like HAD superfamily hydrolase
VRLAVFDLDGTLTATTAVDSDCFARAFSDEFGFAIDTDWDAYPHPTDSGIIHHNLRRVFGRPATAEEEERFKARFLHLLADAMANEPSSFRAIEGASVALTNLRQAQDWSVAIKTGSWRASAQFKLAAAGIDASGIPAAFCDDAEAHDEIVRTAIARANVQYRTRFSEIVLIGDMTRDLTAARKLSLAFVGVDTHKILRDAGAAVVIDDFRNFDSFLNSLTRSLASPR